MSNPKRDTPYFRWGLTAFLSLSAVIVVYILLTRLTGITVYLKTIGKALAPVAYGLAFAYLLCYPMGFFERLFWKAFRLSPWDPLVRESGKPLKRRKLSRGLAMGCVYLLVIGLLWAFCAILLPQLTQSIQTLIDSLDDYYATVETWVLKLLADNPQLEGYAVTALDRLEAYLQGDLLGSLAPKLQGLLTTVTSSVLGIITGLFNILVGLIISIYVLFAKDTFLRQAKKLLRAVLPDTPAYWVADITGYAHNCFGKYLTGVILDAAIVGVLCFVGCSVLGVPYAPLIAVVCGCTNIIPFFGPFLGGIPSAFLVLMADPVKCLYFVIFLVVMQQVDGNIINPRIQSSKISVPPFWIIVSVLLFGQLFGFLGMVIGAPCFAVVYYIITLLVNRALRRKRLQDSQIIANQYPNAKLDGSTHPQNPAP